MFLFFSFRAAPRIFSEKTRSIVLFTLNYGRHTELPRCPYDPKSLEKALNCRLFLEISNCSELSVYFYTSTR